MEGIYVVFIIFMLFILYNYLFVYEGLLANTEALTYTQSINKLLNGDEISFKKVNITGNNIIVGKSSDKGNCNNCIALAKGDNNWLYLNVANDFTSGVFVDSDLAVNGTKKFCIGSTCITEDHLKVISGKAPFKFTNQKFRLTDDANCVDAGGSNFHIRKCNNDGWQDWYLKNSTLPKDQYKIY